MRTPNYRFFSVLPRQQDYLQGWSEYTWTAGCPYLVYATKINLKHVKSVFMYACETRDTDRRGEENDLILRNDMLPESPKHFVQERAISREICAITTHDSLLIIVSKRKCWWYCRISHCLVFFCLCASVVSYVAFVLSLFVPHLSFFWCLGRDVFRDCGISWVYSHISIT